MRPALCWFLVCTFLRRTILFSARCTSGAFVCVDSKSLFKGVSLLSVFLFVFLCSFSSIFPLSPSVRTRGSGHECVASVLVWSIAQVFKFTSRCSAFLRSQGEICRRWGCVGTASLLVAVGDLTGEAAGLSDRAGGSASRTNPRSSSPPCSQ